MKSGLEDGHLAQSINKNNVRRIKVIVILALIAVLLYFVDFLFGRHINSIEEYKALMDSFGFWGPLLLTIFQAFQVVLPVVPGYLGCAAGAISFGTWTGFICNYVGISAGSIAAYFLARRYGEELVTALFSEKLYNKWKARIEAKKSYDVFLFVATLLPLFPDDFLCYFSGMMKMDKKRFIWIIILGKPWCILAYSIIFGLI